MNQKDVSGLGQNPDNGLLVTHVNQTQDLLVKTVFTNHSEGRQNALSSGVSSLHRGSQE